MQSFAARARSSGAASTSGRGASTQPSLCAPARRVLAARRHPEGWCCHTISTISISSTSSSASTPRMPPRSAFFQSGTSGGGNNANNGASSANDKTNEADAAAVADLFVACSPRVQAALRAIAADPRGALRQYARDPEVMAALGTVLSRGMAPGRRAAIERLLAATADEAQAAAGGGAAAARRRKDEGEADQSKQGQRGQQQGQQQQSQQQQQREVPAPGKVVAAMFSDPELARLMADPEVKAALGAARAALLGGGGDAGARRALEGRGAKVDRAMELLEARLGRFVGSAGTVDV